MGKTFQRRDGENSKDFQTRIRAEQEANNPKSYAFKPPRRKAKRPDHDRVANRVDGYDRDNLGPSGDY